MSDYTKLPASYDNWLCTQPDPLPDCPECGGDGQIYRYRCCDCDYQPTTSNLFASTHKKRTAHRMKRRLVTCPECKGSGNALEHD